MPAVPAPLILPPEDPGDALDALLATAKAASTAPDGKPSGDAALDVLTTVAEVGDGVLMLSDLLAARHSRAVIAALLTQGADKRVRPRLALGLVAGHEVVWLRSAGWQSVGQQNRREAAPTARSLRHRLSGHNLESALENAVAPVARRRDVLFDVVRGVTLREYIDQRKGDAWVAIRTEGAEGAKDAGTLTGGVYPDALVAECWPTDLFGERLGAWPSTGDPTSRTDPQPAEFAVAVEIELSGKAAPLVAAKIRQHDTAMRLGWWQAVVWVTDDTDTLKRLIRAGLGHVADHPGHYVLGGSAIGLDDPAAPPIGVAAPRPPWWAGPLSARP